MIIRPAKRIRGRLTVPGDKSISHRAAMIAAIANGTSQLGNYSTSADCASTLSCLTQLGVQINRNGTDVTIWGVGPSGLHAFAGPLDCGNSGTTMRLLAGVLAGHDLKTTLAGDESLSKRPMQRIIEPLEMMGAKIAATDGHAPLQISGHKRLRAIDYELLVASAQVKSCILLAGINAEGRTVVIENETTRDHTERMLRFFGAPLEAGVAEREPAGAQFAAIKGPANFEARNLSIPGDISSAVFFIAAAALLPESFLEIHEVGLNPTRALFLKQLKAMGFQVTVRAVHERNNEPAGQVIVRGTARNQSRRSVEPRAIEGSLIPQLIDELPLLAIVGSQLEGGIEIRNARELRVKESDRIATTVAGLKAMGAAVEEFEDGLRVAGPVKLRGDSIDSHGDHRIAMAFTVAALLAEGETEIKDAGCVAVSFPEFFDLLDSVLER
ncbi:MAG TPA: 3-phosphoshikimate 1-carboxyvinyltransferase [Pyrinomonadaceae bacterium]|nr:3-phosphoshikimate 1-carboxyvinyltransferase [Pyrinomonadaceae bacterium]